MVFSWYSSFFHQWNWPPRYNWNTVESGVKHHNPNPEESPSLSYKCWIEEWSGEGKTQPLILLAFKYWFTTCQLSEVVLQGWKTLTSKLLINLILTEWLHQRLENIVTPFNSVHELFHDRIVALFNIFEVLPSQITGLPPEYSDMHVNVTLMNVCKKRSTEIINIFFIFYLIMIKLKALYHGYRNVYM